MGLERAGALRQLQYEELANKIDVLNTETAQLTGADQAAGSVDEVAKARSELKTISAAAQTARKNQQAQIAEVDAELEATKVLSPEAARVKTNCAKSRMSAPQFSPKETKRSRQPSSSSRGSETVLSIASAWLASRTTNTSAQRMEAELARLANPRRRIFEKFDAQIASVDKQIAELRGSFDELRASSPAMTADQRERLQSRRRELEELLVSTSDDWQRQIDQGRAALEAAQNASATEASTFASNQTRRDQIAKEISELERQRVPLARTDQVRRIAFLGFSAKSPKKYQSMKRA